MAETREQQIRKRIQGYEAELATDEAWIAAEEAAGEGRRADRIEATKVLMEGAREAVTRLTRELESLKPEEVAKENKQPAEDGVQERAAVGSTLLGSCLKSIKSVLGISSESLEADGHERLIGGLNGNAGGPKRGDGQPHGGNKKGKNKGSKRRYGGKKHS